MYSIAPIDGHSTDLRGVIGNLDSGKNGVIGSNMACKYCKNEQNLLAECENNYEGIEAYLLKDVTLLSLAFIMKATLRRKTMIEILALAFMILLSLLYFLQLLLFFNLRGNR